MQIFMNLLAYSGNRLFSSFFIMAILQLSNNKFLTNLHSFDYRNRNKSCTMDDFYLPISKGNLTQVRH